MANAQHISSALQRQKFIYKGGIKKKQPAQVGCFFRVREKPYNHRKGGDSIEIEPLFIVPTDIIMPMID